MAFCGSDIFDEKKEDFVPMSHSLENVVAFSTCRKQICGPSKEGLLIPNPNKDGVFKDRRIKLDYSNPIFFCNSLMSNQVVVKLKSGKKMIGSGTIIQINCVNHLLTCAHNLCSMSSYYKQLIPHENGHVYDVRYGTDKWQRLYKLEGEGIRIHPKYNDDPSCGFDIAVAPITIDIVNDTKNGTVSLRGVARDSIWMCAEPKSLKPGMKVEICGYPGEMNGYPYYHFGEITKVAKQARGGWTIYYNLDSTPGMSGSAISITDEEWIKKNIPEAERKSGAKKALIGIHTGHDQMAMLNYGTLITPNLKKWIEPKGKSWLGLIFGSG